MGHGMMTTLTRANNTSTSLRTTVPMSIIKQFDLKEGDQLDWSFEARGASELVIVVRPIKKVKK